MELPDSSLWKEALESDLRSLREHGTWVAEMRPEGAKTLPSRFVFRKKLLQDGSVCSYKARLVVKGYMQGNVDFTYAPVVDFSMVRAALAIAVKRNYVVHQMDVRTAFLHGEIDEDVYIMPHSGSGIILEPGNALRLLKGLYGLKLAPRPWHSKWMEVMSSLGFEALLLDTCVYRRDNVWVLLYVDDVIVVV